MVGGLCCCRNSLTAASLGMVTSPAACTTFWIGESTCRSFAEWGAEYASVTTSSSSTWRVPQQTRANREGRGPTTGLRPFLFPVNPPSRRGCRRRPRSGVLPIDLYLRTGILCQDHHPGTHLNFVGDSYHELPRTPCMRTSQNPQKAKFAEFLFYALR